MAPPKKVTFHLYLREGFKTKDITAIKTLGEIDRGGKTEYLYMERNVSTF